MGKSERGTEALYVARVRLLRHWSFALALCLLGQQAQSPR